MLIPKIAFLNKWEWKTASKQPGILVACFFNLTGCPNTRQKIARHIICIIEFMSSTGLFQCISEAPVLLLLEVLLNPLVVIWVPLACVLWYYPSYAQVHTWTLNTMTQTRRVTTMTDGQSEIRTQHVVSSQQFKYTLHGNNRFYYTTAIAL